MKPTIGRIVLFNALNDAGSPEQHAAMIVAVHGDACVSLSVFNPRGGAYHASSKSLGTSEGTWQWPVIASATPAPAKSETPAS